MKQKKKNNIPLAFDYKFKKVFGDNDNIERLEVLVSIILKIPYEQIKGNITILNGEKRKSHKNEKGGIADIYLSLKLPDNNERIDIEVSNQILNQSTINRDIGYGAYFYQSQLKKSEDYNKLESITEVWLDRGLENIKYDENVIVDEFYYMNKNNEILSTKSRIMHIDIEKCYNIWYTNSVQKFNSDDQNIIYLGALLSTSNIDEFKKCLEELPMSKKIKKDIEETNEELNELDDLLSWYDREKDLNARYMGYAHDWAKKEAQELAQDMAKDMAKDMANQTLNNEKMKIAKKLIAKGIPIDEVASITNLSIAEIMN